MVVVVADGIVSIMFNKKFPRYYTDPHTCSSKEKSQGN